MREIPTKPDLPTLNDQLIQCVTDVCFQDRVEKPSDVLFVFGSWTEYQKLHKNVSLALEKKISNTVILNGGVPSFEKAGLDHVSIADRVLENIDVKSYPNTEFILENTATHTLEEVQRSTALFDFSNVKTISYIAKSHAATRQMLTLKKYVPQAEYRALPYDVATTESDGSLIAANTWMDNNTSMQRVWGQFLRIKKYGERGDIAYPDDVRKQVDFIINKTGYSLA